MTLPPVATVAVESDTRTPILTPILMLLKSRKVIMSIITFLVSLLILAIPALAIFRTELLTLALALGLAVIGGTTLEDVATNARGKANEPVESLDQYARDLANSIIDELTSTGTVSPATIRQAQALKTAETVPRVANKS